jgi:hypothetical protein
MGELNTTHEEMLATSLEDPEYFGSPIRLHSRDDVYDMDVYGSINKIQPKLEDSPAPRPVGKSVGCSVRHTTLMEKAGYPDNVDWRLGMPTYGWLVDLISPFTNELETYTLEKGSIFRDETLGLDTYWLTEYKEV